jgi:proton glutamate symport protein
MTTEPNEDRGLSLHWKILIGLALGAIVGVLLNIFWTADTWKSLGVGNSAAFLKGTPDPANDAAGFLANAAYAAVKLTALVGKLFINSLRFIAVPIVLFSLIIAVAGLGDIRKIGRIGGKTIALFLSTAFLSVVIGVTVSNVIRPGDSISPEKREQLRAQTEGQFQSSVANAATTAKALSPWDFIADIVPTNPIASMVNGQMLQIVFTAIMLGIGLTLIPSHLAENVVTFSRAMTEAIMVIIRILMKAAPYAVFALMAPIVAGLGVELLSALAMYCLTVILGLSIILFALYPALMLLLTPRGNKVGYRRFFRAMAPAQLLAFSSSSSAATLPVTIQCCRDRLGVDEDITSFVCTLGTSFNMDGTALYQAVAATFLAQAFGVPLTLADQLTIVFTATLISIGTPGVPGASIVLMVVVLEAVRVPTSGIAIILAVDRILDMSRTIVNVSGDGVGACIIAGSEGKLAKPADHA